MITMVALLNAERIFPKYISKSRPKFQVVTPVSGGTSGHGHGFQWTAKDRC